jgi:hypothetical protein
MKLFLLPRSESMKRIDLTGQRFGRLTVISYAGTTKKGRATWQCKCDCGNNTTVMASHLKTGHTISCGCFRREKYTTHGMTHTSTHGTWAQIKNRCLNPNDKYYKDYGGRGITICSRWLRFENFLADMGEKPDGLTIERVNNNKGYSLENCKWATRKEQSRNKRDNRMVSYFGETKCLAEWAEELNINSRTLIGRLNKYPPQIALNM